jgi:hypothetical protein
MLPRLLTAACAAAAVAACTQPPRRLPPDLMAARTDEEMRAALARYVFVGQPVDSTTRSLQRVGFACQRARNPNEPASPAVGTDTTPYFCGYDYPGSDPRSWAVLIGLRADNTVAGYGVAQPPFMQSYGKELLVRRKSGGPMPDIGDHAPVPRPQ